MTGVVHDTGGGATGPPDAPASRELPGGGPPSTGPTTPAPSAPRPLTSLRPWLPLVGALAATTGVTCTAVWAAAGTGYFWPAWVWLPLVLAAAAGVLAVRVLELPTGPRRRLLGHAASSGLLTVLLVAVWGLVGPEYPWPVWPVLVLAAALGVHAALELLGPGRSSRERELTSRVQELTRTRRGAVDVQTVELRRIERDLHDGAQARLVALSLELGRAELALEALPDTADRSRVTAMVTSAHGHAALAITELRELARGIAPPILVDRGLAEAVSALGRRAGVPVTVDADVVRRAPASVEAAAYFVAAESVTNAAKHAGTPTRPVSVTVALTERDDQLVLTVTDDGRGGADPSGSGLSGLAHRVAALDGTFDVTAGPGGIGTVVRATFGCGG